MVKIYVADLKVKEILNTVFDENNLELTNVGLILGQVCSFYFSNILFCTCFLETNILPHMNF